MTRTRLWTAAALLASGAAMAQSGEGLGLDLTAPDEPVKEEKAEKAQRARPAEEPAKKSAATRESLLEGERDVTVEDRVKSVQRKLYLKKNRLEIAPSIAYAVNDPYLRKFGASLRAAWYLSDTLAISARGIALTVQKTDDVPIATRTFQSVMFFSEPRWGAIGAVEWSPIYGKVAFLNDIVHFDAYVLGGLGMVITQTSSLPDRGPNPAAELGLGVRFVAKDYLAVNAALINTSFVDTPAGTTKGATQNVLTLNAGVSFFFPMKSTTREAE